MTVRVVYASKHGSTQGIAERIAEQLRQLGLVKRAMSTTGEEVLPDRMYA